MSHRRPVPTLRSRQKTPTQRNQRRWRKPCRAPVRWRTTFGTTGGASAAKAASTPLRSENGPFRIIQTNLQHSQTATACLRRALEVEPETIALIQEPWIRRNKICGLSNIGGDLLLNTNVRNPRTCIFTPKHIQKLLITDFCSRDLTAVRFLTGPNQQLGNIVLASAYLPGDADIPTPELVSLVEYCDKEQLELIICTDSNAHHTLWSSVKNNTRGEELVNYLISTKLTLINIGSEPTFVNSRSQTIIDLTLATEAISNLISDWHVSREASCADHRWIRFNLNLTLPRSRPRRQPRKTDRHAFVRMVKSALDGVGNLTTNSNTNDIEQQVNKLTSILTNSYEQSCPLTPPMPGPKDRLLETLLHQHRNHQSGSTS
ncbi:hypothetical protein ABMA28_009758 [Loxostege sticticalis]|uniref:Endonuclease/exonuclease/phosphatase domain-containing protein n=1 Tax=Loxostege sticticalis TaxID=481309 RepID=A0ABD0SBC2_LOXSC